MWITTTLLLLALNLQPSLGDSEAAGEVWDDQLSFFTSIHIPGNVSAGEAVCILCSIRVDGELRSEAVAVWGDIVVSGSAAGELVAAGGSIRLLSGSRIGDEVVAVGGHVSRQGEVFLAGPVDEVPYVYFPGQRSLPWPGAALFAALGFGGLLMAAGALPRERVGNLETALRSRPVSALLLGIATPGLLFLAGWVTAFLGPLEGWVNWPAAVAMMMAAWFGSAGVVACLGGLLFPLRFWKAAAAGSGVLVGLMMIPVLGLPVFMLLFLVGLGLAVVSALGSSPTWLLDRVLKRPVLSP